MESGEALEVMQFAYMVIGWALVGFALHDKTRREELIDLGPLAVIALIVVWLIGPLLFIGIGAVLGAAQAGIVAFEAVAAIVWRGRRNGR